MSTVTSTSLDMRGKTITTFIAYAAARRLAELAEGETLELLGYPRPRTGPRRARQAGISGEDVLDAAGRCVRPGW